jgi:competence ComEA-like helix-hairpin-helix protein
MRKSHLIVLSAILILTISNAVMAADVPSAASSSPAGVVNINTADASQLALLPRVGLKAAQRILDYRKDHGSFQKTSDLMQVKGFGEKSYERLSPWLTVEGKTTLAAKAHIKSNRPRKSSKKSSSPSPTAR